jgi:hypothetical protein
MEAFVCIAAAGIATLGVGLSLPCLVAFLVSSVQIMSSREGVAVPNAGAGEGSSLIVK